MIYVRHPTDEEHIELQCMTRQEVGRVSQRAQMVLLSAQRRSVPEIAAIFALRKATVRQWLPRFDVAGPAGLYDAARSGRPRKVTEVVRDTLATLVTQDPAQAGYLATFWGSPALRVKWPAAFSLVSCWHVCQHHRPCIYAGFAHCEADATGSGLPAPGRDCRQRSGRHDYDDVVPDNALLPELWRRRNA